MSYITMRPIWEPCPDCQDVYCNLHQMHAGECPCPEIDAWEAQLDTNPYDLEMPVITNCFGEHLCGT